MDLAAAFAAVPGAKPIAGLPDAWFWTHAPKFGHSVALSEDREHAFHCYAHNSYDEGLARAILVFAREHDELVAPPDRPLVVAEGFTHPGYGFDTVVAVSPAIHRYHEDQPEVHEATRAVYPAYRCEFSGAETEDQAAFRATRAPGAQPTRWDREPNPYLRMRLRTATGREIPERGFANPTRLVFELTELPGQEDGFVEFENYERRVWTVTWQEAYVVTEHGDGAPARLDLDEVLELARTVLYGPNRASGESAFVRKYS